MSDLETPTVNATDVPPPPTTVLSTLLHNGGVVRAVLLAVGTVVLIAQDRRTMVPFAVSLYAEPKREALDRTTPRTPSSSHTPP